MNCKWTALIYCSCFQSLQSVFRYKATAPWKFRDVRQYTGVSVSCGVLEMLEVQFKTHPKGLVFQQHLLDMSDIIRYIG